ncbi:MAG TPA: class I SAM-dependent methyltransferase [Streptomyces sp.]|nr:class I SAM-dependent methyltransferase [Streptomyces sp.]
MTTRTAAEAAWDRYAEHKARQPVRTVRAGQTWFNWTQYPDHGPDEKVLGSPSTALELGCGTGRNAAHLALRGVEVTGVDISGVPLEQADEQWGRIKRLRFVQQDAVDFLRAERTRYSAIYSVFGAAWFTDPKELLPLVRSRLKPGGVYAFSHEPPIEGCYGCQGVYVRTRSGRRVPLRRWAYTPAMWHDLLRAHGFQWITAGVIPPPEPDDIPTLIVRAR